MVMNTQHRYGPPYASGAIYAALGQTDQAMFCLRKALDHHSVFLLNVVVDSMLDSLRSDPRFQTLERRVRLS